MVEGHGISILKLTNDSCHNSFLTESHMHLTGDFSLFPDNLDALFEEPASVHFPVQLPEIEFRGTVAGLSSVHVRVRG